MRCTGHRSCVCELCGDRRASEIEPGRACTPVHDVAARVAETSSSEEVPSHWINLAPGTYACVLSVVTSSENRAQARVCVGLGVVAWVNARLMVRL